MQPSDDEIRAMLAGAQNRPTPWLNAGGENALVTDCYMLPVAYYVPSSLRPLLAAAPDLAALALSRGEALAKAEAENARLREAFLNPERIARSWWCIGDDVSVSGYQRREAIAFLERLGFDRAALGGDDA